MSLHLLPLGVGDAYSATHYATAFALECDGRWLLVDCPHPIRKMLREASTAARVTLDIDRLDGVVLTSASEGRASGLFALGQYTVQKLQRRNTLLAHPTILARLSKVAAAGGSLGGPSLHNSFNTISLSETWSVQFGPFSVECHTTKAPDFSTALRIRADNRTLGYSSTTPVDGDLIAWLAASDVFLYDGTAPELMPAISGIEATVRARMQLIHYDDAHDADRSPVATVKAGRWYRV